MRFTSYSAESTSLVAQGDYTIRFYPARQVDEHIAALTARAEQLAHELEVSRACATLEKARAEQAEAALEARNLSKSQVKRIEAMVEARLLGKLEAEKAARERAEQEAVMLKEALLFTHSAAVGITPDWLREEIMQKLRAALEG